MLTTAMAMASRWLMQMTANYDLSTEAENNIPFSQFLCLRVRKPKDQ
jgi:hypothetical protein